MGRTKAMWAVLLVLSSWPYEATAQKGHRYVGARGEFIYSGSMPFFDYNAVFWLDHRMALKGGIYRPLSQRNFLGIGIGGAIWAQGGATRWTIPIPF